MIGWALLLTVTGALLAGCGQSYEIYAGELTREAESTARAEDYGSRQAQAVTDFGVALLQQVYQADTGENLLLSPLSAAYALGMTANGAEGQTLAQMEQVLGLPADQLSQALGGYLVQLGQDKQLRLANSLWVNNKEEFHPNQVFLDKAAGDYQAQVFQGSFDGETLKQINSWVSQKTQGRIPSILEQLDNGNVMVLLNALYFDAKWEQPYRKLQVQDELFTTEAGEKRQAKMMHSGEDLYWQLEGGQGFLKPYQGGRYAFAALLPPEGTAMADFLPRITGQGLAQALEQARNEDVRVSIPQFKWEGSYELIEYLEGLGMTDPFDPDLADFSALGVSENGPIYIDLVRQKTYIQVDDQGTKAAAVTAVEMSEGAAPIQKQIYEIYLDRPFFYLLLDRQTNTPLMMGVMMDLEG